MLSYEDSKRLKELGYDQALWFGSLYYYWGVKRFAGMLQEKEEGWVLGVCDYFPKRKTPPTYDYVKVPTTDGMIEGLHGLSVWGLNWQEYTPTPDDMIRNLTGHESSIVSGFTGKASEDERLHYRQAISTNLEKALCELWKKVER